MHTDETNKNETLDDAERVARELREIGAAYAAFQEKKMAIRKKEEEEALVALAEAEGRRVEEIKQELSQQE